MNARITHSIGFLKTSAIGGIFFLLPLIVIGFLLGQLAQAIWTVALAINQFLPVQSVVGYTMIVLIAIASIILLCFVSGIIARRRFAKRFSESVEKYLLLLFPRYAILKEKVSGNIGGEVLRNQLHPVMVRLPGHMRLGFEVERYGGHSDAASVVRESVTVFLPGSPDPWAGQVIIVQAHHVEQVNSPFGETVATFEQLGRGSLRLVDQYRAGHASVEHIAEPHTPDPVASIQGEEQTPP